MHVLVTGAAGLVGSTVVAGLVGRGHRIRAHDVREAAVRELAARHSTGLPVEPMTGDVGNMHDVQVALTGVEVVIHLGGSPGLTGAEDPAYSHSPQNAAEWSTILDANIIGTHNVLEAAAQSSSCRRVVYASRAGLLNGYPWTQRRTVAMPPLPVGLYTVSKAFGEAACMSAAAQGLEVVALRIGNFRPGRLKLEHPHQLGEEDCVELFECAAVSPLQPDPKLRGGKYAVVFGVSASNWELYDLEHGKRAIGYHPRQWSEVPSHRMFTEPVGTNLPNAVRSSTARL